jgi:hypothetical protein
MTKTKPVVKYRKSTFKFCGEVHKVRYKLTLLATFNGALAKKIRDIGIMEDCTGHITILKARRDWRYTKIRK